jgi:hypothetical protein
MAEIELTSATHRTNEEQVGDATVEPGGVLEEREQVHDAKVKQHRVVAGRERPRK